MTAFTDRRAASRTAPDQSLPTGMLKGLAWAFGAIVAVWLLNPFVVVKEGNVGVVYTLGKASDALMRPGFHLRMPLFQRVQIVRTTVQPHDFKEIDAASKELQSVKLTGRMNFHYERGKIVTIAREVGFDSAATMMDSAFQDFMKEVVPQYPTQDVLLKRDEIRAKAQEKMSANLGRYGIVVDDIYIANIAFSPEFQKAIEEAQVQAQNAVKESQVTEQIKQKANQTFEDADGKRRAAVAAAEGEAEAIRVKGEAQAAANTAINQSLTPTLVDYTKYQKWNGSVPQVEGGAGTIVDLRTGQGQATVAAAAGTPVTR